MASTKFLTDMPVRSESAQRQSFRGLAARKRMTTASVRCWPCSRVNGRTAAGLRALLAPIAWRPSQVTAVVTMATLAVVLLSAAALTERAFT